MINTPEIRVYNEFNVQIYKCRNKPKIDPQWPKKSAITAKKQFTSSSGTVLRMPPKATTAKSDTLRNLAKSGKAGAILGTAKQSARR